MMRHTLYILTILILTFGCKNVTTEKTKNIDSIKAGQKNQTDSIYNEFNSDSVSIGLKNDNFNFIILLKIGDYKKEYELSKLNIPTKTPELKWINNEYACMITWWSQSQSRHIFIPTKKTNDFIYLDKDIEEMDSINNNIVYLDTISSNDKVFFKVENLLTRRSKSFELLINEQNSVYPYYDHILLTKSRLTMKTSDEKKIIDIKDINNGL